MSRAWAAVALLAGWWLFSLGCFYPAGLPACVLVLVLAVGLLANAPLRLPAPRASLAGSALLVPAVWWIGWPWRTAPLVLWLGLLLGWLAHLLRQSAAAEIAGQDASKTSRPDDVGFCPAIGPVVRALVAAGWVLMVQAAALWFYFAWTARSHDLPQALVRLLAVLMRFAGTSAGADGPYVAMHTLRQPHRMAATWELLADPASVAFLFGAATWWALMVRACPAVDGREQESSAGAALRRWLHGVRILALIVAAWLPLRAALMMAIYLHRVIRADSTLPLHVMNHFFSPWVLTALLAVPAGLAAVFVGRSLLQAGRTEREASEAARKRFHRAEQEKARASQPALSGSQAVGAEDPSAQAMAGRQRPWHIPAAAALLVLAGLLAAIGFWADPVGRPKSGRVMFVERHSEWEPSDHPYDTETYGEMSSYNYKAAYDYLGQYFQMSRLLESERIDQRRLSQCDVLVIKTPTARYSSDEIRAVVRFVERGGGLLFIGDHTNYERSSTYMNDIARHFGFTFRDDLLFGFGASPYEQSYRVPRPAHPAVQHVGPVDLAVSCSIDPGYSRGRPAIRSFGLWSMPPDYHIENFHPFPQHCPEMRYGEFIQLWSTRYGRGRVMAFTDSTIFSNFCIFQPGKAELLRGMIQWLNHTGGNPAWLLVLLALLPVCGAGWLLWRRTPTQGHADGELWMVLASSVVCGGAIGAVLLDCWARRQMPVPELKHPLPLVAVDRTLSQVPLSKGAYTQGEGRGYGLLEQWIARLGYVTARRSGPEVFQADAVVVLCPTRSVSAEFRERLVHYVAQGGRLLVIDSPENEASTANSLLWPFGLSLDRDRPASGALRVVAGPQAGRASPAGLWPGLQVQRAWSVRGGRPLAEVGAEPVAAVQRHGKGLVVAVGFGSVFNDTNMGESWMTEPDEKLRRRFDTLFAILRFVVEGKPITLPEQPSILPRPPSLPRLPRRPRPSGQTRPPLPQQGPEPSGELPSPPGVVAPGG